MLPSRKDAHPDSSERREGKMILTADYILPISSSPVIPGAVAVEGQRIAGLGPEKEVCRAFPGHPKRRLKGCVLMPGLVNAHTHLQLSGLKGRLSSAPDFVSWILALIQEKKGMQRDEVLRAVRLGATESLQAGTTCLGEITDSRISLNVLQETGLRGLVFLEVLGQDVEDPRRWTAQVVQELREMQVQGGGRITAGISPHSPYTLSRQRLQVLSDLLAVEPVPYAVHLAESREEVDYFLHHRGKIKSTLFPAVGWQGMPDPGKRCSPLAYLQRFGLVTDRLLAVHGVHLGPEDMDQFLKARSRLVLCPRSNEILGVGRPPVEALLERDIPLGLGTDSLASNTSLSLWDEMRHLRSLLKGMGAAASETVLRMATLGGAKALGLDAAVGSIEVGKEADLIAVERARNGEGSLASDLIERSRNRHVRMVMVAGRILLDRTYEK